MFFFEAMLCRKFLQTAKRLGCATKITFAMGHGYTREEILLMEKERQGLVERLRSTVPDEWHIPKHILVGQAFSYETELHSFVNRIGSTSPYVSEGSRNGDESLFSSSLVVALSHPSSCASKEILELKDELCRVGRSQLSWYLMSYFAKVFPNISSEILYKLSVPEMCLSSAKCYSMYKQLCLHELIRTKSEERLTLEEYSDATGGIFLSILLFDEQPFISAPQFLQSCILNYYSQLDFRDVINHDNIETSETKLRECLPEDTKLEIRIISVDGEESTVPLYNIGIFIDSDCVASAAERSVEHATVCAANAALTHYNFSERNTHVNVNSLGFSSLSEDIISKGKEIETKLKELVGGVDLSKLEMESGPRIDRVQNYTATDLRKLSRPTKTSL